MQCLYNSIDAGARRHFLIELAFQGHAVSNPTTSEDMGRVEGKFALVTGGRRGLGAASAVMLGREGARVLITDRKEEGADAVLDAIESVGGQAIFVPQDVSKEEEWKRAIDDVSKRFGKLGVLVNNAGVGAGKNIDA